MAGATHFRSRRSTLLLARGTASKIAAEWISDKGHVVRRIEGGFKAARNKLLSFLAPDPRELLILGGSTGVGKTVVIENDAAAIDLEGYANHRGSAFGAFLDSQPSQIDFENAVALQFYKETGTIRTRGKGHRFFWRMRDA